MAPIRRYLRITKYSVLECRIYVDNPALAESWLLNSRDPVLPRVIQSVRPLVLPKLREEHERSKKGGKKKGVKDVVVEEDFEVSIFLTETSTRHSLLTKQKTVRDTGKQSLQSNSHKLMGATNLTAIDVEDGPVVRREDSDDDTFDLQDVPTTDTLFVDDDDNGGPHRSKRPRAASVQDGGSSQESSSGHEPLAKRQKEAAGYPETEAYDDKKKMAMDTSYDGFSIYSRILCLVVKRKDTKGKQPARGDAQAMMENWITSTQMPLAEDD